MPEDDVTLWSWCTFSFVEPMFSLANVRTVNESDVWTLSPYFLHKNLFEKYLDYVRQHPKHTLLRFLIVSNSLDLILDVVLEMWSVVVGSSPPPHPHRPNIPQVSFRPTVCKKSSLRLQRILRPRDVTRTTGRL